MDEPTKHYAEGKKPHTENHILSRPIYMKCAEQAIQRQTTKMYTLKVWILWYVNNIQLKKQR